MSKAILTLDRMPLTCDRCPLFVKHFGHPAYCIMHAEYTLEEIARENNGNLKVYYHGCLSRRPEACPLQYREEEKVMGNETKIL